MFVAATWRPEMDVVFEKTKTVLVVGKQPKEIAYLTKHLSIAVMPVYLLEQAPAP
jgi:hypothetical protein